MKDEKKATVYILLFTTIVFCSKYKWYGVVLIATVIAGFALAVIQGLEESKK